MMNATRSMLSGLAAALVIGLPAVGAAQSSPTRAPVPIELMAREPFMSQMQLSPDGEHLAALTSLDGVERSISVWRTSALSTNPVRLGVSGASARSNVRFEGIVWVANDRLLVLMSQPVDVGAGAQSRIYTGLARIVDLSGSRWIEPLAQGGRRSELERFAEKFLSVSLLDQLPNDREHVLMQQATLDETSVYRVNVYTGAADRVLRLSEDEGIAPVVDRQGNPRVKVSARFEGGDWIIGYELFDTATASWRAHPALSYPARSRRNLQVVGLDPQNEDLLFVIDTEGRNFAYARAYSISQSAFVETMFAHEEHDVSGVLLDQLDGAPTSLVGFSYLADAERPHWIDPAYQALYASLVRRLPGRHISIGSRSGRYRVITAQSSIHPPTYYLMTEDRDLSVLGSSIPDFPSATLAPTQLVRYPARDGMSIPAFLTLPLGWRQGVDPPLPVIIQPHGGPWSRNTTDWGGGDIPVTQYFASRGFAVLQPQFRGSTGFGNELWFAGDGQWGLRMQDDKDDGLAWLVQQGIADPSRAIIYGFSYGGFAAMAATVRPNPPYRCAISGAGVSSLERLGSLWRRNRIQRQLQGATLAGMDPLQQAGNASIPILLYHGDRDQTATIWHSEQFASALGNKPHQFVVIPDMAHGAGTTAMRRQEFTLVEDYIRGPCGIAY